MRQSARFAFPILCLLAAGLNRPAHADPADRALARARSFEAALQASEAKLRLRHNTERLIALWAEAVEATSGQDRAQALEGEARARALLAHWSGRADDKARAEEARRRASQARSTPPRAEPRAERLRAEVAARPVERAPAGPRAPRAELQGIELVAVGEHPAVQAELRGEHRVVKTFLPAEGKLPARLVFDLSPAEAPRRLFGARATEVAGVERLRVSQFDEDTVRVVLDLAAGVDPAPITFGAPPAPVAGGAEPPPAAEPTPPDPSAEGAAVRVATATEDPVPMATEEPPPVPPATAEEAMAALRRATAVLDAPRAAAPTPAPPEEDEAAAPGEVDEREGAAASRDQARCGSPHGGPCEGGQSDVLLQIVREMKRSSGAPAEASDEPALDSAPSPAAEAAAELPDGKLKRSTREATAPRQEALLRIGRVVIDAGHGGKDFGAQGAGGVREKDVNLAIALRLGQELRRRGIQVLFTRTSDEFLSLHRRARIANRADADLFISVHSNAHKKRSLHGIETYYLNTTSNRYAVRLASRENGLSDFASEGEDAPEPGEKGGEDGGLPGGDLGRDLRLLLADLAMRSATVESRRLAGYVQASLVSSLRAKHDDVVDLGVKHALFAVLLGARMPSVLIETGFLTHGVEGRRLADAAYQADVARAIAEGVARFASEREAIAQRIARVSSAEAPALVSVRRR